MTSTKPPVVFIHGLWLHASAWQPWADLFEAAGYAPAMPGWPGDPDTVEAARANPKAIANHGIADVTRHYAGLIERLPAPPVVIGHSFGGLFAQKLLGMGGCAGAIAIDAAQIKGVLPVPLSSVRNTLPVFRNPANFGRAVSLTKEQFRYGFGNAVSPDESDELHERWSIPAPGKVLFELAVANLAPRSPAKVDTANSRRGPLLLTAGGKDHAVPAVIGRATLKQYRGSSAVTDLVEFPDRGHSLYIDSGWREIADRCLSWLATQGL
jgi:pimeloyl-ACP methyl ester carboxylesterase